MTDAPRFDEWCVFEQLGHVRYAAKVTVETLAGRDVYRLDIPTGDSYVTKYVGPDTMYALHPTTEEVVRHLAAQWGEPRPAQPWELPQRPAIEAPAGEEDDENDTEYDPDPDTF